MTPQIPAEGILKQGDYGDSKMYHVVCECGSDDHVHNLWVEAEDTGVNVIIYTTVKSPWWKWNRFKQVWFLLTRGYLEQEACLIMKEQTALNYAETIKLAVKDVSEFRSKK